MDAGLNQALMTMLPAEVRTALEGGAAPEDLMQSMLEARLHAAEAALASEDVSVPDEPWPELGWSEPFDASEIIAVADDAFGAEQPPAILHCLSELARALGACPACIGESPGCPACGGAGTPGWSVPDPELFQALVLPAANRLQSDSLRRAQDASEQFTSFPSGSSSNGHRHNN